DAVAAVLRRGLRVRTGLRVADVPRFELAGGRAARCIDLFVALLRTDDNPVSANGHARGPGAWARPPRFELARRRAAVAALRIPVVALLRTGDLPVPALHRDARAAGRRADGIRLDLAGRGAAVPVDRIAVVALLGAGHDAVAALRGHANRIDSGARPAR